MAHLRSVAEQSSKAGSFGKMPVANGGGRARAGLIIRRFCLHHAEEDVFGIGQLVLIQDVVLRSCPPEPCRLAALNEYPFWGNIQMLDVSP